MLTLPNVTEPSARFICSVGYQFGTFSRGAYTFEFVLDLVQLGVKSLETMLGPHPNRSFELQDARYVVSQDVNLCGWLWWFVRETLHLETRKSTSEALDLQREGCYLMLAQRADTSVQCTAHCKREKRFVEGCTHPIRSKAAHLSVAAPDRLVPDYFSEL